MIYNATNTEEQRPQVIDYIKSQGFLRVLDVGGAMNPWADEVVTHYFDILDMPGKKVWKGDVSSEESWEDFIIDQFYSTKEPPDRFDFAICTHLIEDIRNPEVVLSYLPHVAKEGFISFPSKHWELCRGVECSSERDMKIWGSNSTFRGFFHHRWIYSIQNNQLVAFPKLNFVDHMSGLEWATRENKDKSFHETSFWWKDDIPFRFFNDDYLGPNGYTVFEKYRNEIKEGL